MEQFVGPLEVREAKFNACVVVRGTLQMPKCVKSETQIVINYKKIDKNSVLLYRVVMSY